MSHGNLLDSSIAAAGNKPRGKDPLLDDALVVEKRKDDDESIWRNGFVLD